MSHLTSCVLRVKILYEGSNKTMNDSSDFENRKTSRRQNIEKKKLDKYSDPIDFKGSQKIKKALKKQKEEMRQQELWEDWEDEIS